MRSTNEDRTTRAVIRDEALRLFAERGPDAVTVRQIAAAAGVSAALVVHHFGSKDGLREALDRYVLDTFDGLIRELVTGDPLAEALLRLLPPASPIPAYLRRLLLTDGEAGRVLFRRLYEVSRAGLDAMVAADLAAPGDDPAVRAAILLTNDLAVLLLRDHVADVLGVDPLSAEGLGRWTSEGLAIYERGLR